MPPAISETVLEQAQTRLHQDQEGPEQKISSTQQAAALIEERVTATLSGINEQLERTLKAALTRICNGWNCRTKQMPYGKQLENITATRYA